MKTKNVTKGAVIAALYVVLTLASAMFGLSGGMIQIRLSEMLCILPIFTPAAVPGLFLGCLIANLITGCAAPDVIFGALATLLGAVGAAKLKHKPYLAPIPTVAANVLIVPLLLRFVYGLEAPLSIMALWIFLGESISAYLFGILLIKPLKRTQFIC